MVIGANSTATGISNLGCGERTDFIQCKQQDSMAVEQLDSVAAQLETAQQFYSSAPACSSLLWSMVLWLQSCRLIWREVTASCPWWVVLMQMRIPNTHSLIGLKKHSLDLPE